LLNPPTRLEVMARRGQGHDPWVAGSARLGPSGRPRGTAARSAQRAGLARTHPDDVFMVNMRRLTSRARACNWSSAGRAAQHAEVGGSLMRFRCAARAFLEVLLDAGVLVAGVDGDIDAAGDDPGGKDAGRLFLASRRTGAAEDQFHLLGRPRSRLSATSASKNARPLRGWSNTRVAGHLDLAHRQLPPVTPCPVCCLQRQRQARQPAFEEHVDRAGAEPSQIALQPGRVVGAGEAVGQRGEPDAFLLACRLANSCPLSQIFIGYGNTTRS